MDGRAIVVCGVVISVSITVDDACFVVALSVASFVNVCVVTIVTVVGNGFETAVVNSAVVVVTDDVI